MHVNPGEGLEDEELEEWLIDPAIAALSLFDPAIAALSRKKKEKHNWWGDPAVSFSTVSMVKDVDRH